MILTDEQKRMHEGEYGPGVQKAMAFLIEYGEAFGGQRMAQVDSVHSLIDPEDWASRLLEGVDKVRVNVATLHSLVATETRWAGSLGISEEKAVQLPARVLPLLERYKRIGFTETMTCAPYLVGDVLPMGAVFSSIGSSGIIINNSQLRRQG